MQLTQFSKARFLASSTKGQRGLTGLRSARFMALFEFSKYEGDRFVSESAYLYSPVRKGHFVASFGDPVVPSFLHPRKVVAAVIVLHAISEGVRLGLKITD